LNLGFFFNCLFFVFILVFSSWMRQWQKDFIGTNTRTGGWRTKLYCIWTWGIFLILSLYIACLAYCLVYYFCLFISLAVFCVYVCVGLLVLFCFSLFLYLLCFPSPLTLPLYISPLL
jgi:hypothetical protein